MAKNKFYWLEGTTKKEIEGLLNNKGFNWLRSQRNRRILVISHALTLLLLAFGIYYQQFKEWLGDDSFVPLLSMITVTLLALFGYSLLRISVRGISDAPDELLDERQRAIRNSNYRYSYQLLGFVFILFTVIIIVGPEARPFGLDQDGDATFAYISFLMTAASLPSMVMAWRERDI